ncbi:MAG: hypothetical protein HKN91_04655 [Acidimicrobiia bacterium]|nr:hypothetical protein [Acidimicrobiia bacterium]
MTATAPELAPADTEPIPGELIDRRREEALSVGGVAAALLVWYAGVTSIDIGSITDLGILPALNFASVLGPAMLVAAFLISLGRGHRSGVLLVHTMALVLMLFGTGVVIEPIVSFHVSWRHAGVVDHIARGLGVDPTIDVYFNWPLFFIVAAWISDLVGAANPIDIAAWSPVLYNLSYLFPVLVIGRSLGVNRRSLWMGIWFFYLGNWIGQDYFSPQGIAYLGYLSIAALVFRYLLVDGDTGPSNLRTGAPQVAALGGIVVIYSLIVPTHQLTPIVALFLVAALAFLRLGVPAAVPVYMVVAISAWWTFMASEFLSGNLQEMVDQVGRLDALAGANVSDRLGGSTGHQWVVRTRVISALVSWIAAFIGWLHLRRAERGPRFKAFSALFFVPFLLVPLASYGGEMVLRVFLFTLPAVAFLATTALERIAGRSRVRFFAAAAASLAVLFVLFPITKYGNESTNLFTLGELELVDAAYDIAPDGSAIVAGIDNLPWKYREYDLHKHILLERIEPLPEPAELPAVVTEIAASRPPGDTFLILNRVQFHHLEVFGVWPVGTFDLLARELLSKGVMEVAFENGDGFVLRSRS